MMNLMYFSDLLSVLMNQYSNYNLFVIAAIIPAVATKKLMSGRIAIKIKKIRMYKRN